jgi:hypothetical protein
LAARLQCVTHDDVVDRLWVCAGLFEGALDGDGSEFLGAYRSEPSPDFSVSSFAAEPLAEWSSRSSDDDDVLGLHGQCEQSTVHESDYPIGTASLRRGMTLKIRRPRAGCPNTLGGRSLRSLRPRAEVERS